MPYEITDYSKARAEELGVTIKPSTRKGKKIDVFKKDKKVASIGAVGYGDFPTFRKREGLDFAKKRQKAYKARHAKDCKKKDTAGYYACNILW